ncbi:mitochondrial inner membrane protease subunit 1 [Bradysia coprophila]|uniref:mitochondrial inner membrane protease subunit 1 n=1 Tax=Bradysia coprophila TaxID=38358 RepID=UPI00187DD9F0|nr:mitochondrial inner membrane protease subunit 1 [Bradysia coprophila]
MLKRFAKTIGVFGYVIQYGCWTHCVFEYIGDFVICSGPSMEPTLRSNNILITERISPRLQRISRNDIIIAKNPNNPKQNICKRVIGLPGDKILTPIHLNPFTNNDSNSTVDQTDDKSSTTILSSKIVVVPRGHVWIEGDNSGNSSDSRFYGPIPQGLIRSRAMCRIWPLQDITIF